MALEEKAWYSKSLRFGIRNSIRHVGSPGTFLGLYSIPRLHVGLLVRGKCRPGESLVHTDILSSGYMGPW